MEALRESEALPRSSATFPAIDLSAPSPYTARAESMIRKGLPVFPATRVTLRQDMLLD
jgi:hypothetical protein